MDIIGILRGLLGVIILIGIAFLISNNKKKVNWRLVIIGLGIQLVFAILIIKGTELGNFFAPLEWPKLFFTWLAQGFVGLMKFTTYGAEFVFGPLAIEPGREGSLGVIFAFQILTSIIFFATIMSILYYLGIMQRVVQGIAWLMHKLMRTSGAETLSCAANIFVGQTEAPLMIKPFVQGLTKSELLTVMTGGLATIAGGVMFAYIQILSQSFSAAMQLSFEQAQSIFATHLLGASVMSAPAALVISKVIYPETEQPETLGTVKVHIEKNASNVIEATAIGASDGLKLALNVGAMLIAFIAIIYLINHLFFFVGDLTGINSFFIKNFGHPLSLQLLLGLIFQFIAFGIGVPWEDSLNFGSLVGTKITINEFVAYYDFSNFIQAKQLINQKTILMGTYALCGFANFGSIGILIGGLSPIAPTRRADIAKLGIRALIAGVLASLLTATLAGILF